MYNDDPLRQPGPHTSKALLRHTTAPVSTVDGTRNWTVRLPLRLSSAFARPSVLSSVSSMSDAPDDGSEAATDRRGSGFTFGRGAGAGGARAGCWFGDSSGVDDSTAPHASGVDRFDGPGDSSPQDTPEACRLLCSFVSANCRSYSSRSFSRDSCSTRMRVTRNVLRLASQAPTVRQCLGEHLSASCGARS